MCGAVRPSRVLLEEASVQSHLHPRACVSPARPMFVLGFKLDVYSSFATTTVDVYWWSVAHIDKGLERARIKHMICASNPAQSTSIEYSHSLNFVQNQSSLLTFNAAKDHIQVLHHVAVHSQPSRNPSHANNPFQSTPEGSTKEQTDCSGTISHSA